MHCNLRLGRGAILAEVALVAGEATSPIQNLWFWLKSARYVSRGADVAFAYVSWLYAASYVLMRSVIGVLLVRRRRAWRPLLARSLGSHARRAPCGI